MTSHEISVNIPQTLDPVYSNMIQIAYKEDEFTFVFLHQIPGVNQARAKAIVSITPVHAKNLLAVLSKTMADYESLNVQTADLKRVGFTVDTGHFTSAGVDIPAFLRAFGPRVFHVHVKDHIGTESVALGAGRTDNRGVAEALARRGYDGYLSTELEVHDRENALRYVRESLAYMKDLAETGARA